MKSVLKVQCDLAFINFIQTKFFLIFLTMSSKNFKALIHQVHLLCCIYEGREMSVLLHLLQVTYRDRTGITEGIKRQYRWEG